MKVDFFLGLCGDGPRIATLATATGRERGRGGVGGCVPTLLGVE